MFKKSLWLILLTALGGFFFSSKVFAQTSIIKIIDPYIGGSAYYYSVSSQVASDFHCSDIGYPNESLNGPTRNCWISGGIILATWRIVDSAPSGSEVKEGLPVDDSGQCLPDAVIPFCDPEGDTDGDGEPNFLDQDSPAFNPAYCSSDPDSQYYCEPDDGGGGDDCIVDCDGSGGGDGGGGDLPSTCEGDPTFSDSCCRDHAEAQCLAKGGLYDYSYISIGSPSCSYTCNDDVIDPDPDPDPDPTPDPDNSDVVNAVNDASNNIASQIADSEAAITGQIAQQTDEIGADINSLETTNQLGFDTLNNTNQTGFTALADELAAIKNNTADTTDPVSQRLLDEIAENTSHLEQIELNSRQLSSNAIELSNQSRILEDINSGIGSLNDSLNGDIQNDDSALGSFGDGAAQGADASVRGVLEAQFGSLDKEIPNETINLSDEANKFDPMLNDVSGTCSSLDESFTFRGKEISVNLNPVCDVFDVLSYFVIAAAFFAVPFIVLGVSKK